ncbi:MAG: carbon starvation protein A [Endomicrobium sp.]|jgi:carbon starvation protein|nr:carbon starvation protein A [Endomicrobium sp.]
MNALTLIFASLCIFSIGYRFYGIFLSSKLLRVNSERITPAHKYCDGRDYVPTNKSVLFGHHFSAIAAAGPLAGPVLAAQFGFLPGALWILIGCVLGGAVHDLVVLFASVRHKGQSLATIATKELNGSIGMVAAFAILFILIMTLSGLSLVCVGAMNNAPWSLFVVCSTIPIAMLMGIIMKYCQKFGVVIASILGFVLLMSAIFLGKNTVDIALLKTLFTWGAKPLSIAIAVYGFFASVLPVWFLLVPRGYLSSYLKIGTIFSLALGIIFINPVIQMPAFTSFINGGGPIISGPVIPFIFIIIACGAISGFHAIIGTGTTPKMLNNEKDLLFVGYGAMLVEGFVAIMALIAAVTLMPGDYFAINTPKVAYDAFLATNPGLAVKDLAFFSEHIGIDLAGRTGGAVSLAVGMANIFNKIPTMDKLMAHWYNFAIMFEAVFILTAIDAGTRVGKFFLQDLLGCMIPYFKNQKKKASGIIACLLFTFSWGYLVYTGDIGSIWPLFGISNQLLASCALVVCTTMFIRMNRGKLALLTAIPGIFMSIVTLQAGYIQIFGKQLSNGIFLKGYFQKNQFVLGILAITVMIFMMIVFVSSFKKWYALSKVNSVMTDEYGEVVKQIVEE